MASAVLNYRLRRDAGEVEGSSGTGTWTAALLGALLSLAELG